jgi:hypothetical protein
MPTDPDPVGSEIVLRSVLSDTKARHRWEPIPVAPCRSLQHSCTIGDNDDSEFGMIDRKYVVVMRDGTRGVAYIAEQNVMGKIWLDQNTNSILDVPTFRTSTGAGLAGCGKAWPVHQHTNSSTAMNFRWRHRIDVRDVPSIYLCVSIARWMS